MIDYCAGSEDVGVEPHAGISSAPYQDVKALRGPTTGTPSIFDNFVASASEGESFAAKPSEAFLSYALLSRLSQQCFFFFSFHLPLQKQNRYQRLLITAYY